MKPTIVCFHPGNEMYGADRIFLEAVRALQPKFRCLVVLPSLDGPLATALIDVGVDVTVHPRMLVIRKALLRGTSPLSLPWRLAADLFSQMKAVRRMRPELFYVNTITLPTPLIVAWLLGVPRVCHVHEAEVGTPRPIAAILTAPLLLADVVLSISEATTRFCTSEWRQLAHRVRVVRNAVPEPETGSPLASSAPDCLHLLVIGRWSERKGTDIALNAAAILSERGRKIRLKVVGSVFPGYEWFEEELRSLIVQKGLEEVVDMQGFSEVPADHYRSTHMVLVPSRVEPFGLVSVESQLHGRVTVVNLIPGLIETIDDGARGWAFENSDPQRLADIIEQRWDDWDVSRTVAIEAQAKASSLYSVERFQRELSEIMTTVRGCA